jgi:hypothetical protein
MPRTLRIEFTQPVGKICPVFSYGIRAIQGTKYSHVRLRWVNSTGRDVVYEASGSSVKFVGTLAQEHHQVKVIKYYEIDLDREHYRGLIDLCMTYADVTYGVVQIIGMLIAYTFDMKKNPFSDGKYAQVCSELVGRFLEEVMGFDVKVNLDVAGPLQIDQCLEELASRQLVRLVA